MLRFTLAVGLAGVGVVAAVTAVVIGVPGALFPLIAAGTWGPIGIQLAVDARPSDWQRTAARAWSLLLIAAFAGALLRAAASLGVAAVLAPAVLAAIPVGVLARAIGVWWPRVHEEALVKGTRPGYLIGGLSWGVMSLASLSVVPLAWWRFGFDLATTTNIITDVKMLVAPLSLVVPVRVLYAGLTTQAGDPRTLRLRRIVLIMMFVLSLWGLALGLAFEALRAAPLLGSKSLEVALLVAAWAVALLWVTNLWKSARRSFRHPG